MNNVFIIRVGLRWDELATSRNSVDRTQPRDYCESLIVNIPADLGGSAYVEIKHWFDVRMLFWNVVFVSCGDFQQLIYWEV